MSENLLPNSGVEQGHTDQVTGQIPKRWFFQHEDGLYLPRADQPTARPETNVKPRSQLPPHEHDLYIRDGDHCFKAFLSWNPIAWRMWSEPVEVEPGLIYELRLPVFVDCWWIENGQKIPPLNDPTWAARIRIGLKSDGAGEVWSYWFSEENTDPFYLEPIVIAADLKAPADLVRYVIEFQARWGLKNNGIFIDGLSMTESAGQQPQPQPPAPGKPYPPAHDYHQRYTVLPQIHEEWEAIRWRRAAVVAGARTLGSLSHSIDDAASGPPVRTLDMVNATQAEVDYVREIGSAHV